MNDFRLFFLPFLFSSAILLAQDAVEEKPAVQGEDVVKALKKTFAPADFSFSVKVDRDEEESMMQGMMMGMGGGGAKLEPFTGKLEVLKKGKGLFLVSEKALPGFVVASMGGEVIQRQTSKGALFDLKYPKGDIVDLLNTEKMLMSAEAANWKIEIKADGSSVAKGKIAASIISKPQVEGDGGPMAMMGMGGGMEVENVKVHVQLGADKTVTGLKFKVERFDPRKAMMRRVMEQMQEGGEVDQEDLMSDDSKEDEDYMTMSYGFKPIAKPSARSSKCQKEMTALMKPEPVKFEKDPK